MEQTAVIDHAGEDFNIVLLGGGEHMLAGPGLEGIEDDHGPIHEAAELLKALDHIEGETVGRTWGNAEAISETLFLERVEGFPNHVAGISDAVGVMQHEEVELGSLAALQGLLGGHGQVVLIGLGAAQSGISEARVATGTGAQAFIEIVADDAREAVFVARNAFERLAQQRIGTASAIHVGGDEGANALFKGEAHHLFVMLFAELISVMHEASAAPCAVCRACEVHSVE